MPAILPGDPVLEIAIAEQRRAYDEMLDSYHDVKVKVLTFLGAGIGLLTYLYSSPTGDLFIPNELYGKIFYFGALVAVISSIILLIYSLKTEDWEVPIETAKLKNLKETDTTKYLIYVKKRYLDAWEINLKAYNSKMKMLNLVFKPLVFGAILLIVIKTFNLGG